MCNSTTFALRHTQISLSGILRHFRLPSRHLLLNTHDTNMEFLQLSGPLLNIFLFFSKTKIFHSHPCSWDGLLPIRLACFHLSGVLFRSWFSMYTFVLAVPTLRTWCSVCTLLCCTRVLWGWSSVMRGGAGIAQLVVFGLAVHSITGSILLWGHFPVEGIFPLELTWVQTPFPQKLLRMRV